MQKLLCWPVLFGLLLTTTSIPVHAQRSESRTSGSFSTRSSSSSETNRTTIDVPGFIRPNPTLRPDNGRRSNRPQRYVTITNDSGEKDMHFTITTRDEGAAQETLYPKETYDFPLNRAAKITYRGGNTLFNTTKTIQPGESWIFKRSWTGDVWLEKQ